MNSHKPAARLAGLAVNIFFILFLSVFPFAGCQSGRNAAEIDRPGTPPIKEIVRGDTLLERGESADAIAMYRKAVAKYPENVNGYVKLADAYKKTGLYVDALGVFQDGIEKIPESPELHTGLGETYFLQNQMILAENALIAAVELNADYSPAYSQLARLNFVRDSVRQAIAFASLAAEKDDKNPDRWKDLGKYAAVAKDWEVAGKAFKMALELAKDKGPIREELGDLEYSRSFITNETPEGEEIYFVSSTQTEDPLLEESLTWGRHMLLRYPFLAAMNNNMGVLWWKYGRLDSAIAQFQNAIRLDPKSLAARNNLAGSYMQKGYRNRALAEYQMVLRINPDHLITLENLGEFYMAASQPDEAEKIYASILRGHANHPVSYLRLAQGRYSAGDANAALPLFEKAVTLLAGSAEEKYDDSQARVDSLSLSRALEYYRQARIEMPYRLNLYQKLMFTAYFLSVLRNYLERESPAERTERLLAYASSGLAKCYYDTGDFTRARIYFRKVLELGHDIPGEIMKNLELAPPDHGN